MKQPIRFFVKTLLSGGAIGVLAFLPVFLTVQSAWSGEAATAVDEQVSQLSPGIGQGTPSPQVVRPAPITPPPSAPPPAPTYPEPGRGALNPQTGERYLPSGQGVVNPRTGEYYPRSGSGYVNPRTGEFYPGVDQDRH